MRSLRLVNVLVRQAIVFVGRVFRDAFGVPKEEGGNAGIERKAAAHGAERFAGVEDFAVVVNSCEVEF